jgi:hypothetical protein
MVGVLAALKEDGIMNRGLLALALVVAPGVRTIRAQPAPLGGTCSPLGSCPLGTTYSLSDGSTVAVWDAYLGGSSTT